LVAQHAFERNRFEWCVHDEDLAILERRDRGNDLVERFRG
jgi:hypothetical protein